MAAYPTLAWSAGTKVDRDGGYESARATNGVLKVRKLFDAEKRDFQLVHLITAGEKATLEAFYGANKLLDVSLTAADDGVVYTVRFVAAPVYEWRPGVLTCLARVHLLEV